VFASYLQTLPSNKPIQRALALACWYYAYRIGSLHAAHVKRLIKLLRTGL
jgi:hypothetical protein